MNLSVQKQPEQSRFRRAFEKLGKGYLIAAGAVPVLVAASIYMAATEPTRFCKAFLRVHPEIDSIATTPSISKRKMREEGVQAVYKITMVREKNDALGRPFTRRVPFPIAVTDTTQLWRINHEVLSLGWEIKKVRDVPKKPQIQKRHHFVVPG